MTKDFYRYTDSEGKMPVMKDRPCDIKSHRCYVQYVNDKPVKIVPYKGQAGGGRVYDYNLQEYVDITPAMLTP
jgi:hypothetical protein